MKKLVRVDYDVASNKVLVVLQDGRRTFFSIKITLEEFERWFAEEDYDVVFNNKGREFGLTMAKLDQDDRAKLARVLDDMQAAHKGFQTNGKYAKTCSWSLMSMKTPLL